jgi:hypothetical protein
METASAPARFLPSVAPMASREFASLGRGRRPHRRLGDRRRHERDRPFPAELLRRRQIGEPERKNLGLDGRGFREDDHGRTARARGGSEGGPAFVAISHRAAASPSTIAAAGRSSSCSKASKIGPDFMSSEFSHRLGPSLPFTKATEWHEASANDRLTVACSFRMLLARGPP